jgi:transposase
MPYSEDLRLRVLQAIDDGMSKMTAHKTFRVSRSTIDDWFKLREQTGSVKANTTYRRGKAPTINDLQVFEETICKSLKSLRSVTAAALWSRWLWRGSSKWVFD